MKCKRIDKEEFKPVVIEITLESQEQVNTFSNLCNYNPLCEFMKTHKIDLYEIRECLPDINDSWTNFVSKLEAALRIKP